MVPLRGGLGSTAHAGNVLVRGPRPGRRTVGRRCLFFPDCRRSSAFPNRIFRGWHRPGEFQPRPSTAPADMDAVAWPDILQPLFVALDYIELVGAGAGEDWHHVGCAYGAPRGLAVMAHGGTAKHPMVADRRSTSRHCLDSSCPKFSRLSRSQGF